VDDEVEQRDVRGLPVGGAEQHDGAARTDRLDRPLKRRPADTIEHDVERGFLQLIAGEHALGADRGQLSALPGSRT
jgi:hypothetical protein